MGNELRDRENAATRDGRSPESLADAVSDDTRLQRKRIEQYKTALNAITRHLDEADVTLDDGELPDTYALIQSIRRELRTAWGL